MSKKSVIHLIKVIVSGLLLSWLIYSFDWIALLDVFGTADPGWLIMAGFFIVISMVVSVCKWSLVLKAEGINLPWLQLWKAYWIGIFFNNFLPSSIGGDGIRILHVGRSISNMAGAASSVVIERLLATAGLALTGLLAGLLTNPNLHVDWIFIILIFASMGLLFFLMLGKVPAWIAKRDGKVSGFVRGFLSHGQALRGRGKMVITVGCLSVLFQLSVVAVNYAVFRSLHVDLLGWWDLVYIIPAVSAIAMVPIGINGYGIREGAYVFLFASCGVAGSAALGASLLFAVLVSFCSLYGGMLWLYSREKSAGREYCAEILPE
ncbi:lysylphosphatidylglycerol synthase transmembrane domain-containing protein [Pelotomaculum propionicicum]|uniref:lysylphosphatidylglycerol synthase transmembrane domain-containing protein n=1 Tax=Pelotomaculum propionicicum TaxID=258475 RepID=UPI003B7D3450